VRFANVYGIDMPSRSELIAANRDAGQIAAAIGADEVFYQELPDLIEDVRACNPLIKQFDASCFDGNYITGGVSAEYLAGIEANRTEQTRGDIVTHGDGGSEEQGRQANQLDLGFSTVD
jgi:amidophosphoribosyltransferase